MISNLINTDVFMIIFLIVGIVAIVLSIISIYLSYRTKKRYEEYVAILGKGEDIVASLREYLNDVDNNINSSYEKVIFDQYKKLLELFLRTTIRNSNPLFFHQDFP